MLVKNCTRNCFLAALAVASMFGTPLAARAADILITELRTKSAVDPEDYFELTNVGASTVDVSGWKFDDESMSIAEAAPLNGISSIAPGESVVFISAGADPVADTALFRSYWGGLAGVQVGYHSGPGLGKGDAITLFDAGDSIAVALSYGMTSPNQTHAGDWAAGNFDGSDTYENESAVWVPGTDPPQFVLAAPGVYGSFANTSGEYGSPGTASVPEPTALALGLLSALGLLTVRRR
jgi:hypothetical protein